MSFKSGDAQTSSANDARSAIMNVQAVAQVRSGRKRENNTVRVEHFEVVLISRFSWVADDTKIIHVEGRINTREIF